jgi:hypothetical protein
VAEEGELYVGRRLLYVSTVSMSRRGRNVAIMYTVVDGGSWPGGSGLPIAKNCVVQLTGRLAQVALCRL